MAEQQALEDRISLPTIPKELAKEIAVLEQQFIRGEIEQLRQNTLAQKSLFDQLLKLLENPQMSGFWVRVLSNAPGEIDQSIISADAAILGTTVIGIKVERFELNEKGEGEPRSIRITFEFNNDPAVNPFFTNDKLVKELYWRKQVFTTASGKKRTWEGLVSEPVRINWKKDQDITSGLLDAACDLADAEKKQGGGDRKELPEYQKLIEKIAAVENAEAEDDEEDEYAMYGETSPSKSFFNFFGYRGSDATAEQSAAVTKEQDEKFAKLLKGEDVEEEEEDDDDEDDEVDDDFDEIEIFPNGEELAIAFAEDLWPNALKYYVQSFQQGPEFDEDDFEDDEEDDDDEGSDDVKDEDEDSRPRKKTKV